MHCVRTPVLFAILLALAPLCIAQQNLTSCGSKQAEIEARGPASREDFFCAAMQKDYFVAWTTRAVDLEPTSHLMQFRENRSGLLLVRRFDWRHGYNTRIKSAAALDPASTRQFLVLTQFGGAAEEARVMFLREGVLRESDSRFGDWSEIKNFSDQKALLVIHNAISEVDAPYLFQLRGEHLHNVSSRHPEYYRAQLISQKLSVDGSNVSPTLYDQLALLVKLSGDAKSAALLKAKYKKSMPK